MAYVDVILAEPGEQADTYYTYKTKEENITEGSVVVVPFTRNNTPKTAVVFKVYDELHEKGFSAKEILGKEEYSFPKELLDTVLWISRRYISRKNDALRLIMPPGKGEAAPHLEEGEEEKDKEVLTLRQKEVIDEIAPFMEKAEYKAFLLHGVTASGKTESYMNLIDIALKNGKTAIFLVPEIALTKQIIDRFKRRYDEKIIGVIHSRLTKKERQGEWMGILKGDKRIVIGARSAVFSPLRDIGVIILDEEHETTYKSDMTPKYDTQEVAMKRAMAHNAVLVLGSATPSVTTMYRAKTGIYQLLELKERYLKVPLPLMKTVDMRNELLSGNTSIFSTELTEDIKKCLREDKQVILFLNRRGYSNFISCRQCGYIMECPHCGISLTYHRGPDRGVCHYCGYKETVPEICPSCKSKYLKYFGAGTQKVEETAREIFPDVQISRLDLDTIKKRGALEEILNDFKAGKTKILIGTQIVAKGLDFDQVSLVGIVSADITLNIPDYRSSERTFQLILQAGGRAGRRESQGRVLIQSYTPLHYAITCAENHDYSGFYEKEIAIRESLQYPPFSDMIQVLVFSTDEERAKEFGLKARKYMEDKVIKEYGHREAENIYPLSIAFLKRKSGAFRYQIVIRCIKNRRKFYSALLYEMREEIFKGKKGVNVTIDINPYSFM